MQHVDQGGRGHARIGVSLAIATTDRCVHENAVRVAVWLTGAGCFATLDEAHVTRCAVGIIATSFCASRDGEAGNAAGIRLPVIFERTNAEAVFDAGME